MMDSATPLRAAVYGRESKGKQKSVDDQVTLGLRAIDDHPDWVYAGQYDDGSSASRFATKARQDWQRLADDLAAGKLDVLIVWEITRSSRVLADGAIWLDLCRDQGVLIYVLSEEELYDPRKTRHYHALATELLKGVTESNTTSDRVKRGVRQAAARPDGATPHGRVPYGYRRQLRNPDLIQRPSKMPWDEFYVQVPDPATAPVVEEIFRRIGRADPIVHVVRDLTERGVPSPRGRTWHAGTVRAIVQSVAHLGKRKHKPLGAPKDAPAEVYDAVWPALVTETDWQAANRVLSEPGRRTSKPGQKKWFLSYIAVAKCGGQVYAVPARDGRTAKYVCYVDGCTGIGQWDLDEYITRLVQARLLRDDAKDLLVRGDTDARQAAEQLAELERQLDVWRRSGARGETSPASLAVIEKELVPQIEDAQRRITSATVPAALVDLVTADDSRAVWDELPVAGRREVAQVLFREIRIGPATTRLGRWSTEVDRLEEAAARVTVEWHGR